MQNDIQSLVPRHSFNRHGDLPFDVFAQNDIETACLGNQSENIGYVRIANLKCNGTSGKPTG